MSDRGPIWTARSRSRGAHYRLPCTRSSCPVHQRGHADMRYVRRGARANENGLCWPAACALSCAHAAEQARHRKQALGQRRPRPSLATTTLALRSAGRCRARPASSREDAGLHRTNTSTAPHPTCGHHGSPTTAARKANSLHAVQTVRLAGTGDVAASLSSTLKIWPTPATTSAAPSLDPGSAATQLQENGLQGSFYFTLGVWPS